ncbi:MAG: Lrp/AsnC family transcriptional regulator, partial [Candidatus Thorarchaeota archaeon]
MDKTDRIILSELRMNCRISYETLARSLNITANSVKRRINNLIETGAIDSFQIRLSHAMADVEPVLALAEVLDTKRSDEIITRIGEHPHVTRVGFDSYR